MKWLKKQLRDFGIPYGLAVGGLLLLLLLLLISKMFTFDKDTEAKLATLEPGFRRKVRVFLAAVQAQLGLDPLVTSARRTAAQQDALRRQDKRNPPSTTPTTHMQGLAVDLNFKKAGVVVLRMASTNAQWAPVVAIADKFGFTWGGRFTGYPDRVHFDAR